MGVYTPRAMAHGSDEHEGYTHCEQWLAGVGSMGHGVHTPRAMARGSEEHGDIYTASNGIRGEGQGPWGYKPASNGMPAEAE